MLNYKNQIWIVTNRLLVQKGSLQEKIEKLMIQGAQVVILREKDLEHEDLMDLAISVKKITDKYNKQLIINGDLKCATKISAGGYHASFKALKNSPEKSDICKEINKYKCNNKQFKFGLSVHTVDEAKEAEAFGADYLIAGHVFETDCKIGLKGRGIDFLHEICSNVNIPVIAIGGINNHNIESIEKTEAAGVAVMSLAMKIN